MTSTATIESQITQLIRAEVNALSLDLVEIELASDASKNQPDTLQVTISDSSQHMGHTQCTKVAKAIHRVLEKHGLNYCLEVYSPGVGRILSRDHEFAIFTNKLVEVESADGQSFIGHLISKGPKCLMIRQQSESISIPLESIEKVSLALDTSSVTTELSLEDI